jgi:hypothetical protein
VSGGILLVEGMAMQWLKKVLATAGQILTRLGTTHILTLDEFIHELKVGQCSWVKVRFVPVGVTQSSWYNVYESSRPGGETIVYREFVGSTNREQDATGLFHRFGNLQKRSVERINQEVPYIEVKRVIPNISERVA